MTRTSLVDGVIDHLEAGPDGWALPPGAARALASWLEAQLESAPGHELTELFKLVAHLERTGAPAAGPLLETLRAVPAVVDAARSRRGRREARERARARAFTDFEDRTSGPEAPKVDAARPPGTLPGRALMRPLPRPRSNPRRS